MQRRLSISIIKKGKLPTKRRGSSNRKEVSEVKYFDDDLYFDDDEYLDEDFIMLNSKLDGYNDADDRLEVDETYEDFGDEASWMGDEY